MARVRSAVLLIGLATLVGWVALWSYVAATNRWGIFAVAPALLPLLVASAGVAALGCTIWALGVRRGRWDVPLMLVVAAHSAIVVYACSAVPDSSSRASPQSPENRDLVQAADMPVAIHATCDSAGLDSVYAISLRMQYPPYLDGDFDGDGVGDAAVLVEHRASGKLGIVILHRGTRRVSILGAGSTASGPDDLSWIDQWDVFRAGATMHLTIRDRPRARLLADALWVGRRDSASGFFVWTGGRYVWESHS